jgi:hypothetical protein
LASIDPAVAAQLMVVELALIVVAETKPGVLFVIVADIWIVCPDATAVVPGVIVIEIGNDD